MEPHSRGKMLASEPIMLNSTKYQTLNMPENPSREENAPATHPTDPFETPTTSRPGSLMATSSATRRQPQKYFRSRRVPKGQAEQPWKLRKDPKEKWVTIIPLIGMVLGLVIAASLIYDGTISVVRHKYCSILDDDFSDGLNPKIWTKEAEVGGFGNGQFEQTTTTDENVYIQDSTLIIKPTLQDSKLVTTNNIINLTASGTCTSTFYRNCIATTNTTNGTIIPPVKSGRINTKKGARIRYGRVEVTALLPSGNWLWPAIWLLPINETYGPWPASGEIDIAESRGNNHTYPQGGNNIISSTLHWGPDAANDAWWRTNVKRSALHSTYAAKYHTFGLEWSQRYLFTYVDSRLLQVLYTNFEEPLWRRGRFPLSGANGTRLVDGWSQTGRPQTPFDQEFYLVLNVAVGGTNGWFEDGVSRKPWVDGSGLGARLDFWNARYEWYPTWTGPGKGEMRIRRVRMWQQCDGNEG